MKKTSMFLTLSLLCGLVPALAAVRPEKLLSGASLLAPTRAQNAFPAAAAQGSVWKSTDEYNAYMAMHNEKDPSKKIALAEAFLAKFTDSAPAITQSVYTEMLSAAQQAGDSAKAIETAKKLLSLDPNNLEGLRYLSFAFPFTFKPTDPDATTQLSKAESDAKHGLELLSKVPKPANMTDDQFQLAIKPVRAVFNSAVGFVELQDKNYAASITASKAALEDNPSDLYTAYRLGISYLMSTPPDYNNGFWDLARAVSLARSTKAADEPNMEKYLKDYFTRRFGCDSGAEDVITQAGATASPPSNLDLTPAEKPKPTGNPNVDGFNGFAFALKGPAPQAQCTWGSLKGQPLQLGGFVHDVQKGTDPGSYIVTIALDQSKADSGYDIALQDSTQPKAGDLSQGDPLRFEGTIASYTSTPTFSLTLSNGKINDDDLEAATTKAKTRPRRR